ncbi:MAG TPA: glutaredoxin 3 [Mizugakiibacter sp.]
MPTIEMYTTAVCGYCVAAKNLLKARGLSWQEIRVDAEPVRREEMLARAAGQRTVPQIFVNGHHVGGYTDLVAAERSGRLAEILAEGA